MSRYLHRIVILSLVLAAGVPRGQRAPRRWPRRRRATRRGPFRPKER